MNTQKKQNTKKSLDRKKKGLVKYSEKQDIVTKKEESNLQEKTDEYYFEVGM